MLAGASPRSILVAAAWPAAVGSVKNQNNHNQLPRNPGTWQCAPNVVMLPFGLLVAIAKGFFVGRGIAQVNFGGRGIAGCDRQWKQNKISQSIAREHGNAPPECGDASFWLPLPMLFLLAGASPRSILVAAASPGAIGSGKNQNNGNQLPWNVGDKPGTKCAPGTW